MYLNEYLGSKWLKGGIVKYLILQLHSDDYTSVVQVLNVLKSLCVGNNVAVRTNQNLICDNLLPGCDLLLQTKLVDNIFRYDCFPCLFICSVIEENIGAFL